MRKNRLARSSLHVTQLRLNTGSNCSAICCCTPIRIYSVSVQQFTPFRLSACPSVGTHVAAALLKAYYIFTWQQPALLLLAEISNSDAFALLLFFFFVQACTRCTSLIFAVNSVCALSMNIDVTFKREGLYFNLIFIFVFLICSCNLQHFSLFLLFVTLCRFALYLRACLGDRSSSGFIDYFSYTFLF